jgi:ABC-type transport system substrate-binding protein
VATSSTGTGDFGFPPSQIGDRFYSVSFEPLIREYIDGSLEPLLATKWEVASDLSSITLTLRQGVKFHDGSDFNAAVVKWNLEQQKSYKRSITQFFSSIDVVDNYTVRINLSKYQNNILNALANVAGLITSEQAFEENGLEWCKVNPVGTGPFKFASYEPSVSTKWVKFDGYWQEGKPYLDGIESIVIADQMTQQAALLKGDIDVFVANTGSLIIKDLQDKGFNIAYTPTAAANLWPDSANPESPFAKAEVRQAVSYALDRETFANLVSSGGFQTPAYQLPPPANKTYDPSYQGPTYDVSKAKELLDSVYPNGFSTMLIAPFSSRDEKVAIQGFLAKIGIELEIPDVTMGQYVGYLQNGWSNGLVFTPISPYPNYASGLQAELISTAVNLKSVLRPAGFDSLVEQALAAREQDISKTRQALMLLYETSIVIPLVYVSGGCWTCSPKLHDMGYSELGNTLFSTPENAWLSK